MVLDEAAIPWLAARFSRPFIAMPEYGDIAEPDLAAFQVRELLEFAKGRPIVGAFGSLSKRKGVLTLLRAAPNLKHRDCVIAIAGKVDASTFTREELAEIDLVTSALGDRCWYRPGPIDGDGAFSALLSSASVVYIAYQDWVFSSGLQSIAAHYRVPCVVAESGIMADRANAYRTGRTIDPGDPSAAAAAIDALLDERLPEAGFAAYDAIHTIDAFRLAVGQAVTEFAAAGKR